MTAAPRLAALLVLAGFAGCVIGTGRAPTRVSETNIELDRANFEYSVVHAVGEATRHYVFFIGVAGAPDPLTAAWERLRENADLEGQSAQFVNVIEEETIRWFLPPFYHERVYTVSADAIRFK